jgi:ribonuclease Y
VVPGDLRYTRLKYPAVAANAAHALNRRVHREDARYTPNTGSNETEEPMPDTLIVVLVAAIAAIAGAVVGYLARRLLAANAVKHAESYSERLVAEARAKQKEIVLEGKDDALKLQRAAEEEARQKRADMQRQERLLLDRSESLDRKVEAFERREAALEERERELEAERGRVEELRQRQLVELERVSGLSIAEARNALIRQIVDEAEAEAAQRVRDIERRAAEQGDEQARRILTTVMQRIAADHTSEATVTVVNLPSEEMKGRIIGREGRNIRALEQATGVDLIIDDTPEAVVLSGVDPVRREVARMALTKLISDGRIHPGRIEETVAKCRQEIEVVMRQAGEQAAYDAGVPGLHPELIKLLGRLKYRTSYGQNVLNHCIETARLAGLLAAEIGANVAESKKGGLLHDIGKAVDHEVEGPHAQIGGDIARRYGVNPVVCNAIAAHHQEIEQESVEATVVQIADAISAARPGARGESLDNYVKRLDDLQQIALSFPGVERCYAIQAGREIRILVRPQDIDDLASSRLARHVVRKIEEQLSYPCQIKVTVIRETRAVDYAR